MRTLVVAALVALGAGVTSVAAQGPPLQPRLSIDSGVEAGAGSALNATRLGADLSHEHRNRRGVLRVWGGVTADQWWQGGVPRSVAGAGDLQGDFTVTRRMRVEFSDRFTSGPPDLFGTLTGGSAGSAPRSVLSGSELLFTRMVSNTAAVSVSRLVGARAHLSLSATQAASATRVDGVTNSGGSATFARQFGRFAGWHASYGLAYSTSRMAQQAAGRQQSGDVGVDYDRPLSFGNRPRIGVSGGAAVIADRLGRHTRVNARATLTQRLSGGWLAIADYSRPVEYLPGVAQPLITDAVHLAASGSLSRRMSLSLEAGAASGSVGVVGGSRFASYVTAAHALRRLGRAWNVDISVHDSWYRFDVSPGPGIPSQFARRGLRAALVWAPWASHASTT